MGEGIPQATWLNPLSIKIMFYLHSSQTSEPVRPNCNLLKMAASHARHLTSDAATETCNQSLLTTPEEYFLNPCLASLNSNRLTPAVKKFNLTHCRKPSRCNLVQSQKVIFTWSHFSTCDPQFTQTTPSHLAFYFNIMATKGD